VPGSAAYAKLAPAARVAKTLIPALERIRDAASAADLQEALTVLREYVPGLSEARRPGEVEEALYSWLGSLALHLSKLAPEGAGDALLAFALDDVALDMLAILEAVESGSRPPRPATASIEWAPTALIARDPEAASSVDRVLDVAKPFKPLHRALSWAVEAARAAREPRVYTLAHPAVSYIIYTQPLGGLDADSARWVSRIVCPMLRHRAARAAAQAVLQGLEPRVVAAAIPPIRDPYCRIPWGGLRELAEREVEEDQLLAGLRQLLPDQGLEGRSIVEALEASYRRAREAVRAAALQAFESYPLHLGLAVAALALARLSLESMRAILTAKALRLKPEQYIEALGVEA